MAAQQTAAEAGPRAAFHIKQEKLITMQSGSGSDEKKYEWSSKDRKIQCCASKTSTCTVSKLWEVTELAAFHDAQLQQATSEINAILEEIKSRNKDPERELSFIKIQGRHMLAWTHSDVLGPNDNPETIRKMLRLKKD